MEGDEREQEVLHGFEARLFRCGQEHGERGVAEVVCAAGDFLDDAVHAEGVNSVESNRECGVRRRCMVHVGDHDASGPLVVPLPQGDHLQASANRFVQQLGGGNDAPVEIFFALERIWRARILVRRGNCEHSIAPAAEMERVGLAFIGPRHRQLKKICQLGA